MPGSSFRFTLDETAYSRELALLAGHYPALQLAVGLARGAYRLPGPLGQGIFPGL